tara:strand:- start:6145 stop:8250 length:2106 start_codon:yes stop_codon:yes gene_type:complete
MTEKNETIGAKEDNFEIIYGVRIKLPPRPPEYEILNFHLPPQDQLWVRRELPEFFETVQYSKQGDLFLTEKQEEYAYDELMKCKRGIWMFVNGKPFFITKKYYFYLQWWVLEDGTRPEYRDCDRRYFLFLEHWENTPWCLGIIRGKKRREGASSQATANLVYESIFYKNSNCGLISKSRDDSRDTFTDMVAFGYRQLPAFLKPKQINKEDSVSELVFAQKSSNVKEGSASAVKEEEGNKSKINYRAPVLNAYDRGRMSRLLLDEFGKLEKDVPASQLWAIISKTLIKGVKRLGFVEMPSTVNKLTKGGSEFKLIWENADLGNKTPTVNRLVRYFSPSFDGYEGFIDQFGFSVIDSPTEEQAQYLIEKWVRKDEDGNTISELSEEDIRLGAKSYIQKRREGRKGDDLEEEIRMNPSNEIELFMSANADCIFNVIKLNERVEYLRQNPISIRKVVFYRDLEQNIRWRDAAQSEQNFCWEFVGSLKQPDKTFYYDKGMKMPSRTDFAVIGVDGYSNSQGGKRYGSKASAWVYIKYDIKDPINTGIFSAHLYGRPQEKEELHEQILLCAEFLGVQIYYEFVADDYYTYFKGRGKLGYLAKFPLNAIDPVKRKNDSLERHYGFPITDFAMTKQNDAMISYIEHYVDKIYWMELLEDLKQYDPKKRTPSDRTVSAMIALVGGLEPIYKPAPPKNPLVTIYPNNGGKI